MTPSRWVALLAIALVVTNVLWAYQALDSGVTVTYQSDEVGNLERTIELLASLVKDFPRDATKGDAYRFLQGRYPDTIVKMLADTIEVGDVVVVYRQDSLVRVSPF